MNVSPFAPLLLLPSLADCPLMSVDLSGLSGEDRHFFHSLKNPPVEFLPVLDFPDDDAEPVAPCKRAGEH